MVLNIKVLLEFISVPPSHSHSSIAQSILEDNSFSFRILFISE